jgi:hypothetical protein
MDEGGKERFGSMPPHPAIGAWLEGLTPA